VPVRFRNESLGNIYVANKGASEFDAKDQHSIELLATLVAIGSRLASTMTMVDADRRTLRHILDAAPDGILFMDSATGYVLANPAYEALIARRVDGTHGLVQQLGIICFPDGRPLPVDELTFPRTLREERSLDRELLIVRDDGRRIPVLVRSAPIRDGERKMLGAVVVVRDIANQKMIEHLREEFLAMVVHDLRSPVTAMLLKLRRLNRLSEQKTPVPRGDLELLAHQGLRLSRLVADLLDATRIDLARIELDRRQTDVVSLTMGVVDNARALLDEREVAVRVDGAVPPIHLDAARFEQTLTNILENADKYSVPGSPIDVHIGAVGDGVEIAVTNSGSGIDAEDLPQLFNRFYQTQRARERRSGLGLGLYIAKGLMEAHGGNITAACGSDRGTTTFRLWFPRVAGHSKAA
jgi:signal transduction histidine kinase